MRRIRFSIAGLMFAVAISAVLVAALRSASAAWAGAMLMLSCSDSRRRPSVDTGT